MKKLILIFLLFGVQMSLGILQAQEQADTLAIGAGLSAQDIEELNRPINAGMSDFPLPAEVNPMSENAVREIPLEPILSSSYLVPPVFLIPQESFYPRWATGSMYGYSGHHNDWLRGYQAMAGIGMMQQLGDYWSFDVKAQLYKNSIYYNSASLGGSLHWQPNENFGFTVFGSYSPGSFMSSVNLGQSFNWGGYVTMEGERFGMDLGAQLYYDPFMGHSNVPIVRPYVKVGGAKLGIDVGPMIKDALQKNRSHGNGFSPIPQPIKAIPQVAPRR